MRHPGARPAGGSSERASTADGCASRPATTRRSRARQFIFLAVDTPQTMAGAADLRNIRAATHSIAANLNGLSPIIVNKSTSPIGTGETIEEHPWQGPRRRPSTGRGSCPTPSSCARATRSGTSSIPTGSSSARGRPTTRATVAEPVSSPRGAVDRHRPPDGGDDQVRRELVPRHARSRSSTRSPACARRSASTSTTVVDGIAHDPRIGRSLLPARHRVRRELPAQGRRRAALYRRDVRRRDAGPVGRPGGQPIANGPARSAGCGRASAPSRVKTIARLGPDVQGRHRGHPRLAAHGRRRRCCERRAPIVRAYDPAVAHRSLACAGLADSPMAVGAGRGGARRRRARDPHRLAGSSADVDLADVREAMARQGRVRRAQRAGPGRRRGARLRLHRRRPGRRPAPSPPATR